jgi:hypothetical protein
MDLGVIEPMCIEFFPTRLMPSECMMCDGFKRVSRNNNLFEVTERVPRNNNLFERAC